MKILDKNLASSLGILYNKSRFTPSVEFTSWFYPNYDINSILQNFWGLKVDSRLVALSQALDDVAWRGLVAEWSFEDIPSGQFRCNKDLVFYLLQSSLGKRPQEAEQNLANLSKLELALFEKFFTYLETFWQNEVLLSNTNTSGLTIFLIWQIEFDHGAIGHLAISVPPSFIPKNIEHVICEEVDLDYLLNDFGFQIPMDLNVGRTKLLLTEIKSLENGDLIIFEDSNIQYLWWQRNEFDRFNIAIKLPDVKEATSLYCNDIDIVSGGMIDDSRMLDEHDIFSDLSIELTAQFRSVTLPLKQIAELRRGGVLPLGLLLDSELILKAAGNKVVAKGKLIVVGNQFGLKIEDTKLPTHTKAIPETRSSQNRSAQKPVFSNAKATSQTNEEDIDKQLHEELEAVGLDPSELNELGDLY